MWKYRFGTFILLVVAVFIGFFVYTTELPVEVASVSTTTPPIVAQSKYAFKLGLDLKSGSHLVYKADTSSLSGGDVSGAMASLREVIERRVNLFGVSEPLVQAERGGVLGGGEDRLIVELPGITDLNEAIKLIGATPTLEFKLQRPDEAIAPVLDVQKKVYDALKSGNSNPDLTPEEKKLLAEDLYEATGLTGKYLKKAELSFNQTTRQPEVLLHFESDGEKLFAQITKENVGRVLAIFLDNQIISQPVIREEIRNGTAQISGSFTPTEARDLVRNLNYGALPVPIALASTQTVGASLGDEATTAGVRAGLWSFAIIGIFLVLWYRLPGLLATLALAIYVVLNLALFKLIPVTLTAAGIAAFILSLGMAVDANILIFERMKEELRKGRVLSDAIQEGFHRAWTSIRDSNTSSIITAVILYYFASTPTIKGFALVFFIGVVTSMFTAITASRTLLKALGVRGAGKLSRFLFSSGVR